VSAVNIERSSNTEPNLERPGGDILTVDAISRFMGRGRGDEAAVVNEIRNKRTNFMNHGLTAILFALIAPGTVLAVEVTATEHASLAPGGTIRIEHSYGDLTIEGWDRPEVELTVIKSMPGGSKNTKGEVSKHLERVRVGLESKSSSEVVVSTAIPSRGNSFLPPSLRNATRSVTIEYLIHAPRDAKLTIRHGAGYVLISDVRGNVDASCGRGDIVLMLRDPGGYSIDAASRFGTVTSDFEGAPKVAPYGIGERYATPNQSSQIPRIRLRMGLGGIAIKAVPVEGTGK
jgi:hypothetical protein